MRGRFRAAALAACLLVVATGCSPSAGSDGGEYAELSEQLPLLRTERLEKIVACLDREGFPGAVILPGGDTQISLTPEQQPLYDQAAQLCLSEVCDMCGQPLSRDQWERLYRMQVAAAQCLSGEGFEVSDPPSLQVYLDSRPGDEWSPHREIALTKQEGHHLATQSCIDPLDLVAYW